MNYRSILAGAALGLLGAIIADVRAYQRAVATDPLARFDWDLATGRWVRGAILGAFSGAGIGEIPV